MFVACICIEKGIEDCTHQNINFTSEEMELHQGLGEGMGEIVNVSFLCLCIA